jgi:hypothetical protein
MHRLIRLFVALCVLSVVPASQGQNVPESSVDTDPLLFHVREPVHASPGLAVGLVGNRGEIRVRGLEVRFAPGSARLLTTNADGVHAQQNRSGPIIEDSYFEGMADDAINIYTPLKVLLEVRSQNRWLVSHGAHILPGDRLQVLDPRTGWFRGVVRAVEVTREQRACLITVDPPLPGMVP